MGEGIEGEDGGGDSGGDRGRGQGEETGGGDRGRRRGRGGVLKWRQCMRLAARTFSALFGCLPSSSTFFADKFKISS